MKKHYDFRSVLSSFIPENALEEVVVLLSKYPIHLGLMAPRKSVFGDYLAPRTPTDYHRITINGDLNKYAFLLTFLHEYAHLLVFVNHGAHMQAHGDAWKKKFRELIQQFVGKQIFPDDICCALKNYLIKMPASTSGDPYLMRVLEQYDQRKYPPNETSVDELPFKAKFQYNGEVFEKYGRLRKNYTCLRVADRALFRFNPITRVLRIDDVCF